MKYYTMKTSKLLDYMQQHEKTLNIKWNNLGIYNFIYLKFLKSENNVSWEEEEGSGRGSVVKRNSEVLVT